MSETIIIINEWSKTFETSDTRKRQRLGWYLAPSGIDSMGLINILTQHGDEGLKAFGIFNLLCQLMATLPKDHRGEFRRSSGEAMTVEELALILRIEICHLRDGLQILSAKGIEWVSIAGNKKESADNLPPSADSVPKNSGFVKGEGEGQEEGKGKVLAPTQKSVSKPEAIKWDAENGFQNISDKDLEQWAEAYPACDVKRQLATAHQWLLSNPAKAKKSLWRKFVTNWLGRSQERGGDAKSNRPGTQSPHSSGGRKEPSPLMLETAFDLAWPAEEYPNKERFCSSMTYWQFNEEHRYKLAEAHAPLKEFLTKHK